MSGEMRKEMVIRVQTSSEKGNSKAIKAAAAISGVESVMTIAGEDKSLLLVIRGVGIDSDRITKKLRRKVGHAEVVELRTVDAAAADHAPYRYYHASPSPSPSPYRYYGGMDHRYGGAGGGYPAAQYQQQHDYQLYHPAAATTHTVVHHEYATDPNGCSVM
ncbi:uncharacterized protein [Zea mays]|uniref:Uncharacterized protein n=2 Tax=Zea mays TaxID=4577 RepID=A0A1D6E8T3_MAIZE|nr:uncharacterized protein LOC103646341 [Zea mays]ONM16816.1 hypothetical protein ZEAMMB73_Zm00001d003365 [Zea mays]|eukprot:XP_008669296.1 uncharacterized protein LOC103646341 [Zea mays]